MGYKVRMCTCLPDLGIIHYMSETGLSIIVRRHFATPPSDNRSLLTPHMPTRIQDKTVIAMAWGVCMYCMRENAVTTAFLHFNQGNNRTIGNKINEYYIRHNGIT